MPFQRPSLQDLITRSAGDIQSRLAGTVATLRRAMVTVFATVLGGALNGLYGFIAFIARQIIPSTAESEFLRRWASFWGVTVKDPTFASGPIPLTGTNGVTVLAGTILVRPDGAQYATNADVTIAGGTATPTVTALVAGVAGNTLAGVTLTFFNPVAGVQNTAVLTGGGLTGGADAEIDADLLGRLETRVRQPPQGGADADYIEWAQTVAGVTRVWVFRQWLGLGTVGVTFVLDRNPVSIIPAGGDVAAVQAAIDALRPVTADVTVFAPTADPLALTIHLNPDTAAIRTAVTAELADLVAREAIPSGTLLLSHIRQSVSNATGEVDNAVSIPAADVVAAAGHITTLGVITWI